MPGSFWPVYFEKLAIVAVVLGALYLIARRLAQTRLFTRSGRRMTVLESMILSQHAALYVVRVGSRSFLIGTGVRVLADLAEADAAEVRR